MTAGSDRNEATLRRAYQAIDRLERRLRIAEEGRREPIAIVGTACRFPGAVDGPESFWELLHEGRSGITRVPEDRWDADAFYDPDPDVPGKSCTVWGGFVDVDGFDPQFFGISPGEARTLDPQQRIFLEVAWEALENAAISATRLAGSRTGVFVGVASSEHTLLQSLDPVDVGPTLCVATAHSVIPGRLSYLLDLRGPSVALDTACSSSLSAVHFAARALRQGDCDLAIVGAVNATVSPLTTICGSRMGVLSPSGQCHTFDSRADGFVRAEGCGVVVLRRQRDALERREPIWASIRGSGLNQDGRSVGLTAPNGAAQVDVLRAALADADVTPSELGFLESHGTGTPLGDSIELDSIRTVFGNDASRSQPISLGAVKTNLGHLEAAAGMAGLIKTALVVSKGVIPPNHGFERGNENTPLDPSEIRIPTGSSAWDAGETRRIAGVSAFGISGTNAHVVVEEPPDAPGSGPSRPVQLILLCSRTPAALQAAAGRLADFLETRPQVPLADVAHTLRVGRASLPVRVAFTCASREEAIAKLREPDLALGSCTTVDGRAPQVTFLFSGVGDQYPGMAAELYRTEAAFRRSVDECCEQLESWLGTDLREVLFASEQSADSREAPATLDFAAMVGRAPRTSPLDETRIVQPAMFVLEIALARLLMRWGVRPTAVVGHSIGEYAAATVAGVFSTETALECVARRATAIEDSPAGALLAVAAGEMELRDLLPPGVEVAALNAPRQSTVGGTPEGIDELVQLLEARGIRSRRVPGTRAFHTSLLSQAASRLRLEMSGVEMRVPTIPLASNSSGSWLGERDAVSPDHWARHLTSTVRFSDAVALAAAGASALVEIGPGRSLLSFAGQQLGSRGPTALSTLPGRFERGSELQRLLESVGRLWQLGVEIDGEAFVADEERARVRLPTYPFEHVRCRMEPARSTARRREADRRGVGWLRLPEKRLARRAVPGELEKRLRSWLVLGPERGLAAGLAPHLGSGPETVKRVTLEDRFEHEGPGLFRVRAGRWEHLDAVFRVLAANEAMPDEVLLALEPSRGGTGCLATVAAVKRAIDSVPEAQRPGVTALWRDGASRSVEDAAVTGVLSELAHRGWRSVFVGATAASGKPGELARRLRALPRGGSFRLEGDATLVLGEHEIEEPAGARRQGRGGTLLLSGPPGEELVDALGAHFARIAWLVPAAPEGGPGGAEGDPTREDRVREALRGHEALGAEVLHVPFDAADSESLLRACERVKSELGEIDAACLLLDAGARLSADLDPILRSGSAECARHAFALRQALAMTSLQTLVAIAATAVSPAEAHLASLGEALALFQPPDALPRIQTLVLEGADAGEQCPDPRDVSEWDFDLIRVRGSGTGLEDTAGPAQAAAPLAAGARPHLANAYEAPASEMERRVATVWEAVLEVRDLGRRDSFHDLGGNSLLATEVCGRLLQETGAKLDLRDFFAGPTIAECSARLEARLASKGTDARGGEV